MEKNMTLEERMNEELFEEELLDEEIVFLDKNRRRGIRRKKDVAKALRKKRINKETRNPDEKPWYNLHQYSKNKIHCSCPLCRFEGIPHSDQKKIDGMNARYHDFCMGAQEDLECPDIAL